MNIKPQIVILLMLLTTNICYSQTPISDNNWVVHFEDNFDGATLDSNKWTYRPFWLTTCDNAATQTNPFNGGTNHILSNGKLKLIAKRDTTFCCNYNWYCNPVCIDTFETYYTTGHIISNDAFQYGYFEMECKIPQYVGNKDTTCEGLTPCFWLWNQVPARDMNRPEILWSEIDIAEIDAKTNRREFNVHYEDTIIDNNDNGSSTWSLHKEEINTYTSRAYYYRDVDFSGSHKFGCEWTPKYISFYIDDILIYTTPVLYLFNDTLYQYTNKLLPMNFWIGTGIPAGNFQYYDIPSTTLLPYEFEIDYVRVYKLKMDCDNDFYSSAGYNTFNDKVKRNIILTDPIPLGSHYSFITGISFFKLSAFVKYVDSSWAPAICTSSPITPSFCCADAKSKMLFVSPSVAFIELRISCCSLDTAIFSSSHAPAELLI
jgi:beta-glucanase (GH16 family)